MRIVCCKDFYRRIVLLARLERRLIQGAGSAKVECGRVWQSSIIRPALAWLVLSLCMFTAGVVRAEQSEINFNLITLPTDLVATVSIVEDGITNAVQSPSVSESAEKTNQSSSNALTQSQVEPKSELASTTNPEIEPVAEDVQLLSSTTISAEPEASLETVATAAIQSDEQKIGGNEAQQQVGQSAEFNTEIPAIEAEVTEPTPSLVAAADPDGQSQQEDDTSENDIAPVTTEKQLAAQQQDININEDEIILSWATAWSNNDVEKYLSFYSDDFVPDDPTLDRTAWEQVRRKRLQNKNIRIIVSNAEVHRVDDQITEVRFTQRYTSQNYRDRVIKSIEMKSTLDGWKFVSERTVELLPFE